MDTMYNSTLNTGQIHAKVISSINQKECHELPSLIERCQNQEGSVKNSVQEDWSREIKRQINYTHLVFRMSVLKTDSVFSSVFKTCQF